MGNRLLCARRRRYGCYRPPIDRLVLRFINYLFSYDVLPTTPSVHTKEFNLAVRLCPKDFSHYCESPVNFVESPIINQLFELVIVIVAN